MWQQPVDAGAISARGKRGAAEEQCRQLQDQLRQMGCTEEFTPNEALLDDGMVRGGCAQGRGAPWIPGGGADCMCECVYLCAYACARAHECVGVCRGPPTQSV